MKDMMGEISKQLDLMEQCSGEKEEKNLVKIAESAPPILVRKRCSLDHQSNLHTSPLIPQMTNRSHCHNHSESLSHRMTLTLLKFKDW